MGSSRSFGSEKTRGRSSLRKGPLGDVILDIYSDVDDGFNKVEVEVDSITSGADAAAIAAVEGEATLDLTGDVTIADGKKLGVGTTSPDTLLTVAGDVKLFDDTNDAVLFLSQGNTLASPTHNRIIRVGSDGLFQVRDQIDSRVDLTIDGDGKVGIGIEAPSEALDVVGNIKASGGIELGSPSGIIMSKGTPVAIATGVGNDNDGGTPVVAQFSNQTVGVVTLTISVDIPSNDRALFTIDPQGATSSTSVIMMSVSAATSDVASAANALDISFIYNSAANTWSCALSNFSQSAYTVAGNNGDNATLTINWVAL